MREREAGVARPPLPAKHPEDMRSERDVCTRLLASAVFSTGACGWTHDQGNVDGPHDGYGSATERRLVPPSVRTPMATEKWAE